MTQVSDANDSDNKRRRIRRGGVCEALREGLVSEQLRVDKVLELRIAGLAMLVK